MNRPDATNPFVGARVAAALAAVRCCIYNPPDATDLVFGARLPALAAVVLCIYFEPETACMQLSDADSVETAVEGAARSPESMKRNRLSQHTSATNFFLARATLASIDTLALPPLPRRFCLLRRIVRRC